MLETMAGMTKKVDGCDFSPFMILRNQWQAVVLKLFRKGITEQKKKRIQPRLQKAFSQNRKDFYVHAPK
ncbi:hypothetical protein LZ480_10730 [Solibacillus sp. MA9]|uniref:Transposase n=1 Tax=Solibacillus palustris TaxID=2908203 RepID=A0ABS9UDF2_9BACL|nr:hypothetical protein [Solibacillus sp. MA9]MCH7322366.1 hypothetical protein [Solibacillus sp. MA9]